MASGDGNGEGSYVLAAGDVMRGVADDDQAFGREVGGNMLPGEAKGVGGEFVSFLGMVGEGSEGEEGPEVEMLQFDPGAFGKVAGEESLGELGVLVNEGENLANARFDVSFRTDGYFVAQFFQIPGGEGGDLVFGGLTSGVFEEHAADPAIGAAMVIYGVKGDVLMEEFLPGLFESALSGTAAGDQGSVNIPEQDVSRGGCISESLSH